MQEELTPGAPATKDTEFSSLQMTSNIILKTPAAGNLGGFRQCNMSVTDARNTRRAARCTAVPRESIPHQLKLNTEHAKPWLRGVTAKHPEMLPLW